jgi:intracellular sulfur oxidation DsrE/DsrF family protein
MEVPRRSFFSRLAAGMAAVGLTGIVTSAAEASEAMPAKSELDQWLGSFKGSERVFYDATTGHGGIEAILFARNFLTLSRDKLGTKDSDMSVIVSFRHFATPLGYNDAMWAKYPLLAQISKLEDAKTKAPAKRNIGYDEMPGFAGTSLPALHARGARFAVCGAATAYFASLLAGSSGNAATIEAELAANLIPGAKLAPAGVVAVQRAQKARFAYTYTG